MAKKRGMSDLAGYASYSNLIKLTDLTPRRWRMLGMMYLAWNINRLALYPLLVLPNAIPFHSDYKKLLGLFGGNRSSKTYSGAAEMAMVATGMHFWKHPAALPKPPFQCWVITEDFKTAWDVQLQALLYWIPPSMIKRDGLKWSGSTHELHITRPEGDVIIQFRTWTQGFRRQRGRHVVYIWFDEEPEDEDVFREIEFRTLGAEVGRIVVSATPQSGTLSYLYDRIIVNDKKDPEVDYYLLNPYDNFYIDQAALRRLDEMAIGDDEAERDMRIRGLFAIKTGRVYKQYSDTLYDEETNRVGCLYSSSFEIPQYWDKFRAIDPGYEVCAVGWYAIDQATGWCYKYREARFENDYMSDIAKDILQMTGDEYIETTVYDGSDPGAGGELKKLGMHVTSDRDFAENLADMKEKSRKRAGIERVRYYLTGALGPRLLINENCVHTRKEFIRHAFTEAGEPELRNDHHLDETRYFISSRPKPRKPLLFEGGDAPTYAEIIEDMESRMENNIFNIIGGS